MSAKDQPFLMAHENVYGRNWRSFSTGPSPRERRGGVTWQRVGWGPEPLALLSRASATPTKHIPIPSAAAWPGECLGQQAGGGHPGREGRRLGDSGLEVGCPERRLRHLDRTGGVSEARSDLSLEFVPRFSQAIPRGRYRAHPRRRSLAGVMLFQQGSMGSQLHSSGAWPACDTAVS